MNNFVIPHGLTRHAPGSVRELLSISIPLMIASLSGLLMNFCDRLILAHYSTDAMNAAVTAGMAANVFSYGAVEVAIIAEVFVGRYNGAQDFYKTAWPVWQMIWFSIATAVIFLPIGIFFGPMIVSTTAFDGLSLPYFQIWMGFAFLFPLGASLSAFFIGIGSVKIVTIATLVSNIANVCLDYLLVFGIPNVLDPLGIHGAVIATGLAQALQVLIFAVAFLMKNNRNRYGTHKAIFSLRLLKECLALGTPNALGHMVEIAGWALNLRVLAAAGTDYVTVLAMGQNLHILFAFISQGLQKGVIAVGSNLMGATAHHLLPKLIRSAFLVLGGVAAILFIPLVVKPEPIIGLFLSAAPENTQVFSMAIKTGAWVWCFIILDSIVWTMAGVLTIYGDTKFIMITNALAAWFLAVLPMYVFLYLYHASPYFSWVIINVYALLNACFFLIRIRRHLRFS